MNYIKENASLYKKVLKLIKKYNTIVVYRHEMPDFDASGTQNGLVTWLKDSFPNKKIYAQGKDFMILHLNFILILMKLMLIN